MLGTRNANVTINTNLPGPSTTLQRTARGVLFDKKIADAKGAAHFKDHSGIDMDQKDKEHWYDIDIDQLVQSENTAFSVLTWFEIQSMNIYEIINYHANHPFPVLRKDVHSVIIDTFVKGPFQNMEAIRMELKAAVAKAVEDKIKDRPSRSAIRRCTRWPPESGSFFRDISQRSLEDDSIVTLLANHAKFHVYNALNDRGATKNFAKTVA